MFKLYKNAFRTTNEGLILIFPLTLFVWLLTLYIDFSRVVVDTLPEMFLSIITTLFMASAFCAGWFYLVKKSIRFSKKNFVLDKDKNMESIRLIRAMPKGIGLFFLNFAGASIIFLALTLLMVALIKGVTAPFVSEISDIIASFGLSISSPQEMKEVLDQMPADKIIDLFYLLLKPAAKLLITVISIPTIFSFLLLLWIPEIVYTHKNPLVALFTSIVKIFRKFWKAVGLYIYITIIQMLISSLGAFSIINPLAYFASMIVYFYFLVYVVVLIFLYYDDEFTAKNK